MGAEGVRDRHFLLLSFENRTEGLMAPTNCDIVPVAHRIMVRLSRILLRQVFNTR